MKEIKYKNNKWINQDTSDLFRVIINLKSIDEARHFFRDLLTEKEIVEFGQRWKVAKMLDKQVNYEKISKETGMSSTTIARIQKWLKQGTGGYRLALQRIKKNN